MIVGRKDDFNLSDDNLISRTKKIFENSELLDLGCGAGQNTIQYDHMGANCTLVDYDKNSVMRARSLFKNHAKNKFNIKTKLNELLSDGIKEALDNDQYHIINKPLQFDYYR